MSENEKMLRQALNNVLLAFQADDISEGKKHPWIPGASAPAVITMINGVLDLTKTA